MSFLALAPLYSEEGFFAPEDKQMITTFTIIGLVFFLSVVIRLSGLEEIMFGGFRIKFSKQPKQIKK